MALDLSALEEKEPGPAPVNNGQPLELPLDLLYEDEDQPRFEFPEEEMIKLGADIKRRGIMQPILVRPADVSGRHKIIQGARRYRGAKIAELKTAPVLVKADERIFDDYSQVAENIQRQSLTPLELARFIQKRIKAGDKKRDISDNLGLHASEIAQHLALVESDPIFHGLYESGKCTSPQYIYKLVKLHEKYPVEVELFCAESDDFSGKAINVLSDTLAGKLNNIKSAPNDSTSLALESTGNDADAGAAGSASGSANGVDQKFSAASPGEVEGDESDTHKIPFHNPDNEGDKNKEPSIPDPFKIKKPLLTATYRKRDVMILLNKRPTTPGLVFIKYEDGSGEEEVETGTLKNWTLQESNV